MFKCLDLPVGGGAEYVVVLRPELTGLPLPPIDGASADAHVLMTFLPHRGDVEDSSKSTHPQARLVRRRQITDPSSCASQKERRPRPPSLPIACRAPSPLARPANTSTFTFNSLATNRTRSVPLLLSLTAFQDRMLSLPTSRLTLPSILRPCPRPRRPSTISGRSRRRSQSTERCCSSRTRSQRQEKVRPSPT